VPVLTVAKRPAIEHLPIVKANILLVTLYVLVLLHLRNALRLVATCLTKHTTTNSVSRHGPGGWVVSTCILVLAHSMNTLHIKITAIESVGKVVHVVQEVALSASRLVVNLDLINQAAALYLEI